MIKYRFYIKKSQIGHIDLMCDPNDTGGDVIKRIEKMNDADITFTEKEYELFSHSKINGKIVKVIFSQLF